MSSPAHVTASASSSSSSSQPPGQLPALDAGTAANYRLLLSGVYGMMCDGLCSSLPPSYASPKQAAGEDLATQLGPIRPSNCPDLMLLLSLTGIHHFGRQLLEL
jgi:hypothetical protein